MHLKGLRSKVNKTGEIATVRSRDNEGIIEEIESKAWVSKIRALLTDSSSGHTIIPRGNGSYSVGCTDLMSDYTTKGSFLRLYYPSQDDNGYNDTTWIPDKEYFFGLSKFLGKKDFMAKFLKLLFESVKTPAKWNSPLKTSEKYPLIVFSHGLGAFRTLYSAIGNDLASHGFIVAAVEHRDGSASATYYFKNQSAANQGKQSWLYYKAIKQDEMAAQLNKQVRQRAKECSQALSLILDIDHGKPVENALNLKFDVKQLKDSVDRDKVAIIGHSFGGATVIQALSEDQRFRCGIALDAWMEPLGDEVYSRIPQPLFLINSEKFQFPYNIRKMKKLYLPGRERKMITIRGAVHHNFDDFTFATNKVIGKVLTLKGDIDSNVAISLSNKASLAFLQKHLGLQKDFDQWDSLIEGEDEHLIPGTNVNTTNFNSVTPRNSTGTGK
ncbi:PREDICTED: platelet-activating factor acetylhydrolase [Chrysochloris asiatica]|uniref:Platelet-activating factor acetylhydrolase n=1 Tax=Chrysochloris asiatica TaxID=185453 RepID=A0A9B0WM70_CHRAS|nr:PREDICTED: platelet-activating factor acetylhydrolase [Chrysochloris asiatica]